MDFKKLISHIESIDGPIQTPQAPKMADPIRLDEDTELRVLAGVTTLTESVIAEKAVSKAQQKFMGMVHATQKGEKAPSKEVAKAAKGMSKKAAKDFASTKHKGLPEKKTEESIDLEAFGDRFNKMVEAKKGSKPDFADLDKDGDKKEPMKKAAKEAKVKEGIEDKLAAAREKAKANGKPVRDQEDDEKPKSNVRKVAGKSYGGSKQKDDIEEAATKSYSPKQARAGKDIGKPGKQFAKIAKKAGEKYGSKERGEKVAGAALKKLRAKESAENRKHMVAESIEQPLTFKDMMRIVVESGGQQQIDPVDAELFAWASRVARNKLGEGMKAEVYAGMVYERMGGRFEMYDVLSEDQE